MITVSSQKVPVKFQESQLYITTMNTMIHHPHTTAWNLPTKRQIKNFDPTALIQTFGLEDEDANQHDHLGHVLRLNKILEKKNFMKWWYI